MLKPETVEEAMSGSMAAMMLDHADLMLAQAHKFPAGSVVKSELVSQALDNSVRVQRKILARLEKLEACQ